MLSYRAFTPHSSLLVWISVLRTTEENMGYAGDTQVLVELLSDFLISNSRATHTDLGPMSHHYLRPKPYCNYIVLI